MTWRQAENLAVSLGGHLATVRSRAENDWLVATFGTSQIAYIGLNDRAAEGTFVWSSGEPVTFTFWASGEPNDESNEDFALIFWTSEGKWNDGQGEPQLAIIELLAPTATTEPFGTGCPSSAGIPMLAAAPGSLPFINNTFTVELTSLPTTTNHQTFVVVGLSKTTWAGFTLPQDLGFVGIPGCTQYVSIDASVLLPTDSGMNTWDIPIPNDQSLDGLVFFLQGVVQDFEPVISGGAIQWSVTNALEGVIR